jgi:hypothetical protein
MNLLLYLTLCTDPNWNVSAAILSAANIADLVTTINRPTGYKELNPIMGKNAVIVKSAALGITFIVEKYVIKKHPESKKVFTYLNYGLCVIPTIAAIHNGNLK